MLQISEIKEIKVGKKTNDCLNISLAFPIFSILIYILLVKNQRMQEGNISLGIFKNVQFGWEIFTVSPVAYITVDFKKLVSDLFHAGSSLAGKESTKKKTRLSK